MKGVINEWIAWMKCVLNAGWQKQVFAFVYISLCRHGSQHAASQVIITTSTLFLSQRANNECIYASFVGCLARLSLTIHRVRYRATYLCPRMLCSPSLVCGDGKRHTKSPLCDWQQPRYRKFAEKRRKKLVERVLVWYSSKPKWQWVANNTW